MRARRLAREPPSERPTNATYARGKVRGLFRKQVISKAGELFFRVPENPDCHLGFDPRRHSGRPPLFSTSHAIVIDLGGLWLSTPVRKKPPRSPGIQGNHEVLYVFFLLRDSPTKPEFARPAPPRCARLHALRAAGRRPLRPRPSRRLAPPPRARGASKPRLGLAPPVLGRRHPRELVPLRVPPPPGVRRAGGPPAPACPSPPPSG